MVDEASHVGDAPNFEQLTVTGDHITHLRLRVDGLRINAYTIFPEALTTDTAAWEEIVDLPPLTAWRSVRDRIPAEFHTAYERGWTDLGAELTRLFDPADARPRWLRTFTDLGAPDGHDLGDEVPPSWSYSLQPQILLFSIDPFLARLLGPAVRGHQPGGGRRGRVRLPRRRHLRGAWRRSRRAALLPSAPPGPSRPSWACPTSSPAPTSTRCRRPCPRRRARSGWITYARSTRRHPPLAPPQMMLAETDPARTFLPDPATGTLTRWPGSGWPGRCSRTGSAGRSTPVPCATTSRPNPTGRPAGRC